MRLLCCRIAAISRWSSRANWKSSLQGEPFGVLVIDLDEFKSINDEFGHIYGDRALEQVGRTLSAVLRSTDVIGRWGGDEFLAIVRHANAPLLEVLAERCCALVADASIADGDEASVSLSISIGGGSFARTTPWKTWFTARMNGCTPARRLAAANLRCRNRNAESVFQPGKSYLAADPL